MSWWDLAYSQMRRVYGYSWREFWLYTTLGEITAMVKMIAPEAEDEDAISDAEITAVGF